MAIAGMILCGGASRRMGRPKEWLEFDGEPLLSRMVRIVSVVTSKVVVVAAPDQSLPKLPNDVLIARDPESHGGPLVGLAAGLPLVPANSTHVFVTPCDAPLLRPELIVQMQSFAEPGLAVLPRIQDEIRPLPAICPANISSVIRDLLQAGQRSLRSLTDSLPQYVVNEDDLRQVDPELHSFLPMNTIEEYEHICRLASRSHEPHD